LSRKIRRSDGARVRLIAELAEAAGKMANGQQLDLEAEKNTVSSLQQLETIHENKTGAMICVSARAGAIIAEAEEEQLEAVSKYASAVGLLFQITDDLLDATQTTEILGKTAGKDERANKATYVSLYGLAEAQNLARKVHAQALDALKAIPGDTGLLAELADFILRRRK
jgi:geranylgeranyl pyrophosphate synthase